MTAEKVHIDLLRRMARRQCLRLVKSRRRDPLARDYGTYNLVVEFDPCGWVQRGTLLLETASLAEVDAFLHQDPSWARRAPLKAS